MKLSTVTDQAQMCS